MIDALNFSFTLVQLYMTFLDSLFGKTFFGVGLLFKTLNMLWRD